jgi:hypothetical protein
MTTQYVNLDTPVLPDPDRIKWLEANGIDPYTLPAAQVVVVEDGKIVYTKFVYRNGLKVPLANGEPGYEKETVTVPLKANPAEFGVVETEGESE